VSRRAAVRVLSLAALALAAAALASGALGALFISPLAAALGVLSFAVWRCETPRQPRLAVGAGALAVLLAGLLALFAGPLPALLALGAGLAALYAGAQRSLAREPPPAGLALPGARSVRVTAAVAADELLRVLWLADALRGPTPPAARYAAALRAAAERHRDLGWTDAPDRAHPTPPSLEKVALTSVALSRLGRPERLRFASEYEPADPEVREAYLAASANRTAHVHLWRHASGARPLLLCLHGYAMGRVALDARAFDVPWLHRELGLDVALAMLPLHGPRALRRRSGEGFIGGHPLFTNAAFGQAVWDLRRLVGWLCTQGTPAVGVYGMGLGGYTAALFASVERRLACVVPLVPASSLVDLVLRDLSDEQRLAREALGVTRAILEDAWAPHAPLRHRPRVAPEGRLILAGLADRIYPPEQAQALHEHWDRPAIHWFPGSHIVPLGRAALRSRLAEHLRRTLLAARDTSPPLTRFRAS
jgi:hypothetical protein